MTLLRESYVALLMCIITVASVRIKNNCAHLEAGVHYAFLHASP